MFLLETILTSTTITKSSVNINKNGHVNNVNNGSNGWKLPSTKTRQRISAYLDQYAKDHHIPCLLSGYQVYTREGQQQSGQRWIHSNVDGYADIENQVKCDSTKTILKVSSVTKPITAALVASLIEDGRLNWTDDINKYLSESIFHKKSWKDSSQVNTTVPMTLANIASQHAGLRQSNNHDYLHDMDQYSNTTETLKLFSQDPLIAKPGSKFTYSNFGSTLLGAVVEAVEQRSFHLVMNDFLRNKLHMNVAKSYTRAEMFPHLGTQYQVVMVTNSSDLTHHQVPVTMHAPSMDNQRPYPHWPCCSVVATIDDVITFGDQMLRSYRGWSSDNNSNNSTSRSGTFLHSKTVQTIWNYKSQTNDGTSSITINSNRYTDLHHQYVLGWNRIDFPEDKNSSPLSKLVMVSHVGSMDSANAIVAVFPEVGMVFGAIANRGGAGDLESLAVQIYYMIATSEL